MEASGVAKKGVHLGFPRFGIAEVAEPLRRTRATSGRVYHELRGELLGAVLRSLSKSTLPNSNAVYFLAVARCQ
jgi:hypothetical protein